MVPKTLADTQKKKRKKKKNKPLQKKNKSEEFLQGKKTVQKKEKMTARVFMSTFGSCANCRRAGAQRRKSPNRLE